MNNTYWPSSNCWGQIIRGIARLQMIFGETALTYKALEHWYWRSTIPTSPVSNCEGSAIIRIEWNLVCKQITNIKTLLYISDGVGHDNSRVICWHILRLAASTESVRLLIIKTPAVLAVHGSPRPFYLYHGIPIPIIFVSISSVNQMLMVHQFLETGHCVLVHSGTLYIIRIP